MKVSSAILFVALATTALAAPPKQFPGWRSADGSRTITGAFTSLNGEVLTLTTREGKSLTFTLDKLDAASQQRARAMAKAAIPPPERLTAFDGFTLGASIDETGKAVKKVPGVKGSLPPELLGRTGLNGVFSITVAGIPLAYYFGWSANDTLTDISLHGPGQAADAAGDAAAQAAKLRKLLTDQFGEPMLSVAFPEADTLTEGKSFFNEAWQANGRYIYLGAGKLDGKISCVLRCTNQPPPVTKPAPPPGP